jgi:hypothetical protein
MRKWETEAIRHEIAKDAQESLAMFRQGKFKPQSAQNAIKELRECLGRETAVPELSSVQVKSLLGLVAAGGDAVQDAEALYDE